MLDNVRILLVDDHSVMRSSLGLLLENYGAQIIGEAADGETAIKLALELKPDIILMDITLPGINGIEATRRICAATPSARVLALTMHAEDIYLAPFLEAGGVGYIRKSAVYSDLLDSIQKTLQGKTILDKKGLQAVMDIAKKKEDANHENLLSVRERDVLILTARGYTSREIGDQLSISPRTVDTYRSRIMHKLALKHRHQLMEYAIKKRLLE
jgi:two-component system response regulator NreC